MIDHLIHFDKELMVSLNAHHSAFFDWLMWWMSARFTWIPLYLILVALLIWRYRKKSPWPILFAIAAVSLSDQISVHLFKDLFQRLRPCHDPEIGHLMHLVRGYCGGLYGFVSSHASNSFTLAVIISLFLRMRWLNILMFFWACIVSYSRIYMGAHYPGDVLCGMLLGTAIALTLYYLCQKIPAFHSHEEP